MHYLVCVQLHHFYVQALGASGPSPVVIVHQKKVLDANRSALQKGVQIGMDQSEAKAALDGAGQSIAWEEEPYRAAQEQWLDICAHFTDVIEPVSQHEAFLDLSSQPNAGELTLRLKTHLEEKLGLVARMGEARSRWVARLAALCGDPDRHALSLPELFVADKPTSHLLSVPPEFRQRLGFLGYRRIGEVADLSLDTLLRQFGDRGYAIWEAARGHGDPRVRAIYPRNTLSCALNFEGPIQDLQTLERAAQTLGQRLGKRIQGADVFGHELQLMLETEEHGIVMAQRHFIKPLQDSRTVRVGAALLLNALQEKQGALNMRLRASHLRKARTVQPTLQVKEAPAEREHSAERAMDAIRQVFGDHSVERASHIEVPRRTRVLRAWKSATGWH